MSPWLEPAKLGLFFRLLQKDGCRAFNQFKKNSTIITTWIGFSSYKPGRTMVGVSIAFVITGHYIENYRKLLTEEEILKARETASDSGKHSPATQIKLLDGVYQIHWKILSYFWDSKIWLPLVLSLLVLWQTQTFDWRGNHESQIVGKQKIEKLLVGFIKFIENSIFDNRNRIFLIQILTVLILQVKL